MRKSVCLPNSSAMAWRTKVPVIPGRGSLSPIAEHKLPKQFANSMPGKKRGEERRGFNILKLLYFLNEAFWGNGAAQPRQAPLFLKNGKSQEST